MRPIFSALVVLTAALGFLAADSPNAHSGQITTFDPPGSRDTQAAAINGAGQVTGYYTDALGQHGFIRDSDGSFLSFDAPAANGTFPAGINTEGYVTGAYATPNNQQGGFIRSPSGNFITFAGTQDAGSTTWPTAMNDDGEVTGSYFDSADNHSHGFIRNPDGGILTFSVPDSTDTFPVSIAAGGQITGSYETAGLVYHGFARGSEGTIITFDAPAAGIGFEQGTFPQAVNQSGQISGSYSDANGVSHGFVRNQDGSFAVLDVPRAGTCPDCNTDFLFVNDANQIAGVELRHPAGHPSLSSFLYTAQGHITIFSAPGACAIVFPATVVTAVNRFGVVTGTCIDANHAGHGFIRY